MWHATIAPPVAIKREGRSRHMFSNGRYANVTATLALAVALGGTSYAAISLPAGSVGSKQLRTSAVTNSKLRAECRDVRQVRNGSLRARDFKAGQLPAGPAGPAGRLARRTSSGGTSHRSASRLELRARCTRRVPRVSVRSRGAWQARLGDHAANVPAR